MADSPSDKLAASEILNAPILGPGHDFASVTDKISAIVLTRRTPKWWIIGFLVSLCPGDAADALPSPTCS